MLSKTETLLITNSIAALEKRIQRLEPRGVDTPPTVKDITCTETTFTKRHDFSIRVSLSDDSSFRIHIAHGETASSAVGLIRMLADDIEKGINHV